MNFLKKFFLITAIVLASGGFLSCAQANLINTTELNNQTENFKTKSGFNDTTVGGIIATAIEAFLALLGIIFIILILVAGYRWMTAGGNEEKITKAKSQIKHAIIGLAIIIAAYAITYFVFEALNNSITNGGGNGGAQNTYPPPS